MGHLTCSCNHVSANEYGCDILVCSVSVLMKAFTETHVILGNWSPKGSACLI